MAREEERLGGPQLLSGGGKQIGWHRSWRRARLVRLFTGLKSNPCVRARLRPGTRGTAGGFGQREEVQDVLAGGQNAALTPQLLAISSHPSTAGLAVPGRGERSPYHRLPSSKSQRLYFKHPLPKPMLNWLEKALLV